MSSNSSQPSSPTEMAAAAIIRRKTGLSSEQGRPPHQPHYVPACGVLCDVFWWAGGHRNQGESENTRSRPGANDEDQSQ